MGGAVRIGRSLAGTSPGFTQAGGGQGGQSLGSCECHRVSAWVSRVGPGPQEARSPSARPCSPLLAPRALTRHRHRTSSVGSGPPSGSHAQLFQSVSAAGKEIGSSVGLRAGGWLGPQRGLGWGGGPGGQGRQQEGVIRRPWAPRPTPHHLSARVSLPETLMQHKALPSTRVSGCDGKASQPRLSSTFCPRGSRLSGPCVF